VVPGQAVLLAHSIADAHCAHLRGSSRFRAAALAVRSGAALPSARTGERVGALTVIG
jgi:hypothetical protein